MLKKGDARDLAGVFFFGGRFSPGSKTVAGQEAAPPDEATGCERRNLAIAFSRCCS